MIDKVKNIAEGGLVGLSVAFLLATLTLGFEELWVRTGLLGAAFLFGLLVIWTLDGFSAEHPHRTQALLTPLWLAVIVVLGIVENVHASAERQKDVAEHLDFKAQLRSAGNLRSTVVTLTNEGKTGIKYSFTCQLKMLVTNTGAVIRESNIRNHERSGTLDAGKDAQYDECLSSVSVSTETLDCADIQVQVRYFLQTQPTAEKSKEHGFLTKRIGDRFEWADRAANQETSDCEQFVRLPRRATAEEQYVATVVQIKAQNDEILMTHGSRLEKQSAASLSNDIFQFHVDEEPSEPKPPPSALAPTQEMNDYRRRFHEWGKTSSQKFHSLFDSRIRQTLESARKAGAGVDYVKAAQTDCSMISEGFPPALSMTTVCGSGIGRLASVLP